MPRPRRRQNQQKRHIIKSLEYIVRNSDFAHLDSDQIKFLSSALDKIKSSTSNEWHVQIPQLRIPIRNKYLKKHNPSLLIGGKIEGNGDIILFSTFSVCIVFHTTQNHQSENDDVPTEISSLNVPSCCLNQHLDKKRIVRRFHFDFQPNSQGKPISHIQYGGKFPKSDHFKQFHYCLEHFLEHPRLYYPPMDLVLLFDLMIHEFITPLRKWTQEPNWKNLVLKSQELWWSDYCANVAEFISNPEGLTLCNRIYCD